MLLVTHEKVAYLLAKGFDKFVKFVQRSFVKFRSFSRTCILRNVVIRGCRVGGRGGGVAGWL